MALLSLGGWSWWKTTAVMYLAVRAAVVGSGLGRPVRAARAPGLYAWDEWPTLGWGQGGFGEVWLAQDLTLQRQFAVKILKPGVSVDERLREAQIASATRRAITEKMEEDPAFYRQFSEMLQETIRAYRERRLSEREYLNSVSDLASKVARKDRGREVPDSIRGDDDAQALFGLLEGRLAHQEGATLAPHDGASIALDVTKIIRSHLIVGIWSNEVAQNNLRNAIDDYFFDVLRDTMQIELPMEQLDDLEQRIMDLARARSAA
jgi:type I restriction enzyme R subunit